MLISTAGDGVGASVVAEANEPASMNPQESSLYALYKTEKAQCFKEFKVPAGEVFALACR